MAVYQFFAIKAVEPYEVESKGHLLWGLANDRDATLAPLLQAGGNFRFKDENGSVFRISQLSHGDAGKLSIARVQDRAAGWAARAWHAIVDAIWPFGTVRTIQRQLNAIDAIARPVETKLTSEYDAFKRAWKEAPIDICVDVDDERSSLLPWLSSRDSDGPLQLRKAADVRLREDGAVQATFEHGTSRLDFRFRPREREAKADADPAAVAASAGKLGYEASFVERDRRRMQHLLEGRYEDQLGAFCDATELMQQFLRLRYVEEAHIRLDAWARRHDERCGRGHDAIYLTLPKAADGRLSKVSEKVVAVAVEARMRQVRQDAKRNAAQAALNPECYRLVDGNRLDEISRKAMRAISGIAAERLASHSFSAFATQIHREFSLTPAARRFVDRWRHGMGPEARLVANGQSPQRAAVEVRTAGGGELTTVRCAIRIPWYKALFIPRSRTRPLQQLQPGEAGSSFSRDHPDGYRGCVLWLQKFPDALRPHPGGGQRWNPAMAPLTTETRFVGLDRLYARYHTSIYDDYMHQCVLPDVNAEVERWVAVCRWAFREDSKPALSAIGELPAGTSPEEVVEAASALAFAIVDLRAAQAEEARRKEQQRAWTDRRSPAREASRDSKIRKSLVEACDAAQARVREAQQRICFIEVELAAALAPSAADAQVETLVDRLGHALKPAIAARAAGHANKEAGDLDQASGISEASDDAGRPPSWVNTLATAVAKAVSDATPMVEANERALRARLDLLCLGKTTLGELNRWREAEFAYASRVGPIGPPVATGAAPDSSTVASGGIAPHARPDGADPAVPGEPMLRVDSLEQAIEFALRERVEGMAPQASYCESLPVDAHGVFDAGSPVLLPSMPDRADEYDGVKRRSPQRQLPASLSLPASRPSIEYIDYTA